VRYTTVDSPIGELLLLERKRLLLDLEAATLARRAAS
jgi:hypothetical protein